MKEAFDNSTCFVCNVEQENGIRIPARFAPISFGALLSAIMVAIVSAFVMATSQGVYPGIPAQWLSSCLTTWFAAFPMVLLIAPWERRGVACLTV